MKPTLSELEAVAAVARHGGFRAAARELGMSSSALSNAVASLEARLGVRIFNRTTRSVALSEAGEALVAAVTPALATIDEAVEAIGVHAAEPSGTLKLNMAQGAAAMLMDLWLEFARRHPRVQLEIATDNALVDVNALGFDAGVRIAEAIPADMIAVPIIPTLRSVVVASPAYLAEHPTPKVPGDVLNHRCIGMRMGGGRIYRWEFERRGQAVLVDAPAVLTFDATDLIAQAAIAGAGLAYLEARTLAAPLADGRLVTVLDDWTAPYAGLSLYFPGRRLVPAKLRALINLIRERA
jgi:DNA-binding transcriptional LysR family regulator